MRALRWRLERSYRRRLLDAELGRVADRLRGRVLEVGAGRDRRRGTFIPPRDGVHRWVTVDLATTARPDVRADVTKLPFANASFDAALCLEVLEYVGEPQAALREIARALRKDGVLVVSVPFLHRQDAEDDLWRMTASGLRRLLEESGFAVEAIRAQGGGLAVAANVLRQLSVGARPSLGRMIVAGLLSPIFELLYRADRALARRSEQARSFSMGYLAVAQRK